MQVLQLVATASIPHEAARAFGLGRPNGRVRGVVVGDFTGALRSRMHQCFRMNASHISLPCHPELESGNSRIEPQGGWVPLQHKLPSLMMSGQGQPSRCWLPTLPHPAGKTRVGSNAFVRAQLLQSRTGHDALLQRLPELEDLQASWLLLLFCCSQRCLFFLRAFFRSITAATR